MKKLVASVFTAAALTAGAVAVSGAPANADTYGPAPVPAIAKHVIKDVNRAVHHKGKLGEKRAQWLIHRVEVARKYHTISRAEARKLIKEIKHDTRRSHH